MQDSLGQQLQLTFKQYFKTNVFCSLHQIKKGGKK